MFEGLIDHPVWDIILLIAIIRMFIPLLFQIRLYSPHIVRKSAEADEAIPRGKMTIITPHSAEQQADPKGEYVEFEEIR